jgi:hypothetical protein
MESRDTGRRRALNKSFEDRLRVLGVKREPEIVRIMARTATAQRAVITDAEIIEMAAAGATPRSLLEKWRHVYSQHVVDDLDPRWRRTQRDGVDDIVASMAAEAGIVVDLPEVGRRLEAWVVSRTARFIEDVTNVQKAAVNSVVRHYVVDLGAGPRELAGVLRPVIGLTERDAMAVVRLRESLAEEGLAPERVARRADKYSGFLERRRALRVARTEVSAAYNQGQLAGIIEAQETGWLPANKVVKKWRTSQDEVVCPFCGPLNDTVVGLHEGFPRDAKLKQGLLTDGKTPPLHPNCRCTIIYEVVS